MLAAGVTAAGVPPDFGTPPMLPGSGNRPPAMPPDFGTPLAYPLPAILPLSLFSRTAGVVNDVPGLAGNYHILMGAAIFEEENYSGSYTSPPGC